MNHLNASLSVTAALASTIPVSYDDVDQDEVLLMSELGYTLTAIILFLIGFFGFFFNLIVIVLMYKDIQLWTPINIILLNLVCSDFSVAIIGNPLTFTAAIYRKWIFGRHLCVFYGYFMSLLGITSITTLTVLSYERFCLVCRPLSTRQGHNRNSYWSVLFIWGYSFLVTSPPLLPEPLQFGAYVVETPNISCSVNWDSHEPNATAYVVYLFVFGLIVPLGVILYSYINIIRTMKQNACRMGQVNKAESKVTVMILFMIILFLMAWTPYSIFALVEQFGSGFGDPSLAVLPALLAKSSICYNPIIYVGMNSQYRAAWSRFWSGTDEGGLKSGLDTTVHMISSKFSIELDLLKRNKTKTINQNMAAVEEVSVAGQTNTMDNCIKDMMVEQVATGNVCSAVPMQSGNPEGTSCGTEQRLIVKLCDKDDLSANQV